MHTVFQDRNISVTIAPKAEYDIILNKLDKKRKGQDE
jgi:hypothetical protein